MLLLLLGCPAPRGSPDTGTAADTGAPPLGETGPITTPCSAPLALTCGTGDQGFVPLGDGDPVELVYGPQGGWHVWTGALLEHTSPTVGLLPTLTDPATGQVLTSNAAPEFFGLIYDPAVCEGRTYGQRALIAGDNAAACALDGRRLRLRLEGTDLATGATASCEVDVVPTVTDKGAAVCAAQ